MKVLHRPELFSWSRFDEERNLDFNSYFIQSADGNVITDPVAMSPHDRAHVAALGEVDWIVVTNSDHVRTAHELAEALGAPIAGPAAEKETLKLDCARYLADGDTIAGLRIIALDGSKTPGELALLVADHTLITGDLIRAHRAGSLTMLPEPKLSDAAAARASVERLLAHRAIEAVLVGDGWPVFRDGHARLAELFTSPRRCRP